MNRRSPGFYGLCVSLSLMASGCWYYSFSGATIPDHIQTISIPLFEDRSLGGQQQPTLAEDLTEALINRFVRQTRLSLAVDEPGANAVLTGFISRYRNDPASVTGAERAAVNRVTIEVTVRYLDQVEEAELMPQRSFSAFAEYDPLEGLDGEAQVVVSIIDQLAGDIFTAATSNW